MILRIRNLICPKTYFEKIQKLKTDRRQYVSVLPFYALQVTSRMLMLKSVFNFERKLL
jgi:hypothetical protein